MFLTSDLINAHAKGVKMFTIFLRSIKKPSNSFQYLQNWKEFDTMIAHKLYHWDSKESNPSPLT